MMFTKDIRQIRKVSKSGKSGLKTLGKDGQPSAIKGTYKWDWKTSKIPKKLLLCRYIEFSDGSVCISDNFRVINQAVKMYLMRSLKMENWCFKTFLSEFIVMIMTLVSMLNRNDKIIMTYTYPVRNPKVDSAGFIMADKNNAGLRYGGISEKTAEFNPP